MDPGPALALIVLLGVTSLSVAWRVDASMILLLLIVRFSVEPFGRLHVLRFEVGGNALPFDDRLTKCSEGPRPPAHSRA